MRDLKADLKWLEECQSNRDLDDEYLAKKGDTTREEYQNYAPDFSYGITFVESTIAHEWLHRAILAEDCMERRQVACGTWMKKCEELERQLAEHRSAISIIHSYIHPHRSPRYSQFIDDVCDRVLYAKDKKEG